MSTLRRAAQATKISFQGIAITIDRPQGAAHETISADGKKTVVHQKVPYGYCDDVMGDDGMEYDVFVAHNPADAMETLLDAINNARQVPPMQVLTIGFGAAAPDDEDEGDDD